MSMILIPAGIIAALICFRWARLAAVVFLLFTIWWFDGRYEAWKATQPPQVETVRD